MEQAKMFYLTNNNGSTYVRIGCLTAAKTIPLLDFDTFQLDILLCVECFMFYSRQGIRLPFDNNEVSVAHPECHPLDAQAPSVMGRSYNWDHNLKVHFVIRSLIPHSSPKKKGN